MNFSLPRRMPCRFWNNSIHPQILRVKIVLAMITDLCRIYNHGPHDDIGDVEDPVYAKNVGEDTDSACTAVRARRISIL